MPFVGIRNTDSNAKYLCLIIITEIPARRKTTFRTDRYAVRECVPALLEDAFCIRQKLSRYPWKTVYWVPCKEKRKGVLRYVLFCPVTLSVTHAAYGRGLGRWKRGTETGASGTIEERHRRKG